jgi:predicted secreted protein
MVGATISTNYVFKGVKEGKTTITFKYVNIISNAVEKEEKVTVKVDKHKNISLVANP